MSAKQELTIEELRQLETEILEDFHEVCKRNNLKYSIAFGTLLGAVRHGGFIPWDDDIDIIMPRPDYEKFIEIANHQLKAEHRFISIEVEEKFMAPLAKIIHTKTSLYEKEHASRVVLGVYMDIFVYDGVPDKKRKRDRMFKTSILLEKGWSFCECAAYSKTAPLLRPARKLCNKTMLARLFSMEMNRRAKKYLFANSEYMANNMFLGENFHKRQANVFEAKEFEQLTEYQFEHLKVTGFKNYDLFLTRWYGDYMKLPPKDEQVSNHDFYACWKQL